MDIIKFKSGEFPVDFPFDAMVELMGDDGIWSYLQKYDSLKHQIEILKVGLKWASIKSGKPFMMTDAEVKELARQNPRQLLKVFKLYDTGELRTYVTIYFSKDDAEDGEEKKMTPQEKKENEEAVKS